MQSPFLLIMAGYLQWISLAILTASGLLWPLATQAEVRMPAIFGDHMVLQQQSVLPVWGWASPGELVQVTFKNQTRQAISTTEGTWRVNLDPVDAGSDADTLTVRGKHNTLVFKDVLVGDVWIASGQSNMEFGIQTDKRGEEAIARAKDSQIRFFFVPWAIALQPNTDIGPAMPPSALNGIWVVCDPSTMRANWGWHGISAVGYYFATDIRRVTGHPVGLIATYKGGTPAQAWVSLSGLEKDNILAHYVADHQAILADFARARSAYSQARADYEAKLKKWNEATQSAKTPDQIRLIGPSPKAPSSPDGGYSAPANLFNGMVAPIIPYAIKGVIWYQGESNASNPREGNEYGTLFPRLISDWREKWSQGNFPFLFVQLPNINSLAKTPSEGRWPWVREAQRKTALSLPNAGMATTIDLGDADNLHPPDKLYVGRRLALVARHVAYGQDLVYSGPMYNSMTIEGDRIRLTFQNTGSGLAIGVPPPSSDGKVQLVPSRLTGFGVAGEDRNFVWASAKIDGNSVVLSAEGLEHPVAARYDWGQNPYGDLYNKEGLPASPFRTDDWPPTEK
jgi:sialate O-acetylesterase